MSELPALIERLLAEGELVLAAFTSEELVAVGADSPLRGLVISERLTSMGPIPLTAALSTALRGLVAREFVRPDDVEGDVDGPEDEPLEIPLEGDLAIVVALRRTPSLVGIVSAIDPRLDDVLRPGFAQRARAGAVLHGFAAEGVGLIGVLEERRTPIGIHHFTLRTVEREMEVLRDALLAGGTGTGLVSLPGGAATSQLRVEFAVPDEDEPIHLVVELTLEEDEGGVPMVRLRRIARSGASDEERLSAEALPRRLLRLVDEIWHDTAGSGGNLHESAS